MAAPLFIFDNNVQDIWLFLDPESMVQLECQVSSTAQDTTVVHGDTIHQLRWGTSCDHRG